MSTVIRSIDQTQDIDQAEEDASPLHNAVKQSMRRYFYELDGEVPSDIYKMVLQQVELPLLESVLEYTRGNQSKASEYLGLNRGTLRKKLRAYNLDK